MFDTTDRAHADSTVNAQILFAEVFVPEPADSPAGRIGDLSRNAEFSYIPLIRMVVEGVSDLTAEGVTQGKQLGAQFPKIISRR